MVHTTAWRARFALSGALAALLLAAGCGSADAPAGAPSSPADPELALLASMHTGAFTSAAQAARDADYQVVSFRAARIWSERDDGIWLYTEQQVEGTPAPYRQRVQVYFRDDEGLIRLRVHTVPAVERFIGAWQAPSRLAILAHDQLVPERGCDNIFRQTSPGLFEGSTIAEECRNAWRGAAYMRSVSRVHAAGFTNWDRGFTAGGEHVWGPTGGGYEFVRLEDS
jgi:hypothetical protein